MRALEEPLVLQDTCLERRLLNLLLVYHLLKSNDLLCLVWLGFNILHQLLNLALLLCFLDESLNAALQAKEQGVDEATSALLLAHEICVQARVSLKVDSELQLLRTCLEEQQQVLLCLPAERQLC